MGIKLNIIIVIRPFSRKKRLLAVSKQHRSWTEHENGQILVYKQN